MRQCAEHMFDKGLFKVKVVVVCQTLYRVRPISVEPLMRVTRKISAHMPCMMSTCMMIIANV